MTREEVKKKIYDKKVKKALRSYRFRPFKNFIFWLTGVLTSVAVVAGAVFVGVKVVPIKTYTGGVEEGYVSEEIASKSILDVLLNYNQYGMSDIPGITNSLVETIAGSIAGNYIAINAEKLSTVKFNLDKDGGKAMIEGLLNSITLNPEGLSSINESISNLSIFNEYEETTAPEESNGTLVDTSLAKLYYCEDKDVEQDNGGNQPASAESAQTVKYVRAYDDNGKRLAKANAKLYYPALKDVPILDITQMIDKFVDRIDIGEVVSVFVSEDAKNSELIGTLASALEGKNISNLDNIATDLLSKFTIGGLIGDGNEFGDFASLSLFSDENEVPSSVTEGKIDTNGIKNHIENEGDEEKLMLNPALFYYYNSTQEGYIRAFDDDGHKLYSENYVKLYYPNFLKVPLSDLMSLVDEVVNLLDLGEVLNLAFAETLNNGNENKLLSVLIGTLSGKGASDLDNIANDLLSALSLKSILGDSGLETLDGLKNLSAFKWVEVSATEFEGKVELNGNLKVDEEKSTTEETVYMLNPDLYYYEVTAGNYVNAFDEVGQRIAPAEAKIYYANLLEIPLAELLKVFGASFERIELLDLFEAFNITIEGSAPIDTLLGGITIKDLSDEDGMDKILNKLTLDSLGVSLGAFTELSIFSEWEEVADSDMPIKDDQTQISNGKSPKLYYYVANALDVSEGGVLNDTAYARAFNDDGSVVAGVTSSTKLYYAKLSYVGFMDMADLMQERLGGLKVLDMLEAFGNATFDSDSLFALVLGDKTISELGEITSENIYLHYVMPYSADTKGTYELILNAMGRTFTDSTIQEIAESVTIAELTSTGLDFNNVGLSQFINESTLNLICTAINGYRTSDEYKALHENQVGNTVFSATVSVGDMGDFNTDYIPLSSVASGMTPTVKNLICELTNKDFSLILVKDLSAINSFGSVSINTFITDSSTLSLLRSAINGYRTVSGGALIAVDGKITVDDMADFKTDYIPLSSVANGMDNDIKGLIAELVSKDFDEITVNDLTNIDPDRISLARFITDDKTIGMICTAINGYRVSAEYKAQHDGQTGNAIASSNIKVGDIKDFKPDYILLKDVANGMGDNIKELICQLVNETDFDKITVKHLSNMNSFDGVTLNTVLPYEDNVALYKILLEATTSVDVSALNAAQLKTEAEALSISALSSFNISNVRLATAMPSINPTLEKMIKQITKNDDFNSIKISNLSGTIYVDNIDLSLVLGDYNSNKNLYNILLEASGKTANQENASTLKASALSGGNFDLTKVKLKTALAGNSDATDNVILKALIDKDVNLGNIGTEINNLGLYEIFGKTCFTTKETDKVEGSACMFELKKDCLVFDKDGNPIYDEQNNQVKRDAYVHITPERANEMKAYLNNNPTEDPYKQVYYLHKNDGVWLIMCFEFGDIDYEKDSVDYGRPDEYYISNNTLGDLLKTNEGGSNFMSVALTGATLRQLMDAGMITVGNKSLFAKTLSDIIAILDGIAQKYPSLIG